MQKKSLTTILLFYLSITILVSFIILSTILGLYVRRIYTDNSKNKYIRQSEELANNIKNNIDGQINIIEILSQNLSSIGKNKQQNITYKQINDFVSETIFQNAHLRNLTLIIEPDIIEYNDSLIRLTDSTGRYMPHWIKDKNELVTLEIFDMSENEFYYKTTKTNLQKTIFQPHIQRAKAERILKLPVTTTITYGNIYIGQIGAEISLEWLGQILNSNNTQNSEIAVITSKGKIIAVSNKPYFRGKYYTEFFLENQNSIFFNLKNSVPLNEEYNNKYLLSTPFNIGNTDESWQVCILTNKNNIYQKGNIIFIVIILIALLFSLLLSLIVWRILHKNIKPTQILIKHTESLIDGVIDIEYPLLSKSKELASISDNIHKLHARLSELISINNNIAIADYNLKLKEKSQNDEIAKSLNNAMLKINERKIIRQNAEKNQQLSQWLNKGVSIINEIIHSRAESINLFSDKIIVNLCKYIDAYLGGIFIFNDNKDKNEAPYLEIISTFAYNNKKAFQKKIALGEGIIGAVAQEKKFRYIAEVPDDYKLIITGLGDIPPKNILIIPLVHESNLIGIIELAFLKNIQKHIIDFTTQIAENISSGLNSIISNKKTEELLRTTEMQTSELDIAQQMLKMRLQETKQKQEEIKVRESRLQSIMNAVNNTIITIEYTTDGILVDANKKFLETMHFSLDELKGINVLELVKSEREELKQVIEKVSKGGFHEKIMKRFTKYGEEKWLLSTYTPYYDVDGNITRILYFAFDITESKNYTEKLENEIQELKENS